MLFSSCMCLCTRAGAWTRSKGNWTWTTCFSGKLCHSTETYQLHFINRLSGIIQSVHMNILKYNYKLRSDFKLIEWVSLAFCWPLVVLMRTTKTVPKLIWTHAHMGHLPVLICVAPCLVKYPPPVMVAQLLEAWTHTREQMELIGSSSHRKHKVLLKPDATGSSKRFICANIHCTFAGICLLSVSFVSPADTPLI